MGILVILAAYGLLGFVAWSFISYVFCEDKSTRKYEEFPIPKWLNLVFVVGGFLGKTSSKIIDLMIPKYDEEEEYHKDIFSQKDIRSRKDAIDYFQGRMKK